METETNPTPDRAPATSGGKLSRTSTIGVISLVLFFMFASVRPEEEQPAWASELPSRIEPPLERPLSPTGPATLAGVVLGSEGHPVGDALVTTSSGALLAWDYTDADGRFSLEGLPAEDVILNVIGGGHEPQDFATPSSLTGASFQLSAPLPDAPSLPELELVDLSGVVSTKNPEQGLEGYELWLEPLSPSNEFGAPVSLRATVRADRSVTFNGIISGRYRAALLPPWAQMGTWPNLLSTETPVFSVGLSGVTHIELELIAGEIGGTVIDDRGRVVTDALIGVHPVDDLNQVWPPTRTDEHGHFTLKDLPDGDYLLHASAGELSVEQVIPVKNSTTQKVDLTLRR